MIIETKNIFIVDDIEENLHVINDILEQAGTKLSFAKNGKEALNLIPNEKPDLILLDLFMPEMDGFEVCEKLKANEKTADIPVIFLTAGVEIENIVKGFEVGAVDYITKPFNSSELISRVNTHIGFKKARDHIQYQKKELERTNISLEKSAAQLAESEKKYNDIFEFSPLPTIIICEDKIVMANKAALSFFEAKSKHDLIGKNISSLIYPDSKPSAKNNETGVLDDSFNENSFYRKITSLKGTIKEIEASEISYMYQNKPAIEVVFKDITGKLKAERALEESERYFRKIYDNTPYSIITINSAGTITDANLATLYLFNLPGFNKITGFKIDDFKGFKKREFANDFNNIIKNGREFHQEYKFILERRKIIWLNCYFIPVKNSSNKVESVYIMIEDITERKLAEKEASDMALFARLNPEPVIRFDTKGIILQANPAANKAFNRKTIVGLSVCKCLKKMKGIDFNAFVKQSQIMTLTEKIGDKTYRFILRGLAESNVCQVYGSDITKEKEAKEALQFQKDELESSHKSIISSISYARVIQNAVLPAENFLKQFLPESFVLFIPRDIVSGDFYWIKQIQHKIFIVAADCTGHGVPGAFMSMLGIALLNEIVSSSNKAGSYKANQILNGLRKKLKLALHQDRRKDTASDGMDIALCIIDLEQKKMQYAGANNPLYLIRKNDAEPELIQYKPDRMPIGGHLKEKSFTNHEIILEANDLIYIFSDGFVDQFGGIDDRKYNPKKFREFILSISQNPLEEQKQALYNEFNKWKGEEKQVDDVLIMGMKIHESYGEVDLF